MVGTALARLCPPYKLELSQPSLRGAKRRSNPSLCKSSYGLLRFARNDEVVLSLRQSNPTGKSAKPCPALPRKIFRLTCRANQRHYFARLTQSRGGSRSSRTCGGMRWTRNARETNAHDAYGEVVWSWRRGAGAKFLRNKFLGNDGGKRAVHRGEHEVSRKATAQGRPGCSR